MKLKELSNTQRKAKHSSHPHKQQLPAGLFLPGILPGAVQVLLPLSSLSRLPRIHHVPGPVRVSQAAQVLPVLLMNKYIRVQTQVE
jgi:hypothetical protein